MPRVMGVELSWESTGLASRGSRVRISPSPRKLRAMSDTYRNRQTNLFGWMFIDVDGYGDSRDERNEV